MYSPSLFSDHLFGLWNSDENPGSLRSFESNTKRFHNNNSSNNQQNNNLNEHSEEERRHLRSLFAPPLSAYSADYSGASLSQLEYTIQTGNRLGSPLLTPLIQRKLDRLQQIRNHGYSTIRPIGIGKTMEQIEYEEARKYNVSQHNEEQSFIPTAENSNSNIQDSSINADIVNNNQTDSINVGDQSIEVDLDAQIPDADENENENDNEFEDDDEFEDEENEEVLQEDLDDNIINEYEGFMADEVEYQDDHSINVDNNSVSNILINSGASTTTTTTNNSNLGRSIGTSPTTIASNTSPAIGMLNNSNNLYSISQIRESDENQDENENSDLDMVIDET